MGIMAGSGRALHAEAEVKKNACQIASYGREGGE